MTVETRNQSQRTNQVPATPKPRQRTRRTVRFNLGDGNQSHDVSVSSNVRIASAGDGDGGSDATSSDEDTSDPSGGRGRGGFGGDGGNGSGRQGDDNGRDDNDVHGGNGGRGGRGGNGGRGGRGGNGGRGGRSGRDNQDEEADGRGNSREQHRATGAASSNQNDDDDLDSMNWWDSLSPSQQRAMARRLLMQPPAAASQQPIIIQAPTAARGAADERSHEPSRRHKLKKLHIDEFEGKSSESVEAWLATIPQEVERQAGLGGDLWSPKELYYGATAHLKGAASRWLITVTETMHPDDRNLRYLVRKMREKYGSRDNLFRIQQQLAHRVQQPGERLKDYAEQLNQIDFRKGVPAETYVEAFINGINNEMTATQLRAYEPRTLDDAVRFAEDKCGLYGEGYKVTDWQTTKRRYRDGGTNEEAQPARKKSATELTDQIDWRKMGLGFGSEEPPRFDTEGRPVSGLAQSAKKDPLSLAALRAMILVAGTGREDALNAKPAAASKTKTARALELKAEVEEKAKDNQQQQYGGGYNGGGGRAYSGNGGGRGYGGNGSGRGYDSSGRGHGSGGRGGTTGLENYGRRNNKPIIQQMAESPCSYCGKLGHWWRQCRRRVGDMAALKETGQPNATGGGDSSNTTATPLSTAAGAVQREQGNQHRQ